MGDSDDEYDRRRRDKFRRERSDYDRSRERDDRRRDDWSDRWAWRIRAESWVICPLSGGSFPVLWVHCVDADKSFLQFWIPHLYRQHKE